MLHLFFMMMLIGFIVALIALPVFTASLVPWWGTLLIILGELVLLRYTLFKILGLMFGIGWAVLVVVSFGVGAAVAPYTRRLEERQLAARTKNETDAA